MPESAAVWLAGIFGTALVSVLGIIARAVLREPKPPTLAAGPAQTPWEQDKGAVFQRIETVEGEVSRLRRDRHEEASRIQGILGRLELLTREDIHLSERIERLEDGR